MGITWKYVKPLADKDSVKDFLYRYKISLPEDLITVLVEYNGGRPENREILTVDGKEYVFKALLSYNMGDKETIHMIYPELFENTTLYPFASDAAGNFVCYDTKAHKYCLYNHETGKAEDIKELHIQ